MPPQKRMLVGKGVKGLEMGTVYQRKRGREREGWVGG